MTDPNAPVPPPSSMPARPMPPPPETPAPSPWYGEGPPPPGYAAPEVAPQQVNPYGKAKRALPEQNMAYGFPIGGVKRPAALDNAVLLLQAGGVLSLVQNVILASQGENLRAYLEKFLSQAGQTVDPRILDGMTRGATGGLIGGGIATAALWFWMASKIGKGRPWARVVSTILAVLNVLGLMVSFTDPLGGMLGLAFEVLIVAAGAIAVVLMYTRQAGAYFAYKSRDRR